MLVNMIKVENDYETVTYEQHFNSHIYDNQLELLFDYHTRSRSNKLQIEQIVNEGTTSQKPEKEQIPCSSTNSKIKIYQKNHQKKKKLTIPFF